MKSLFNPNMCLNRSFIKSVHQSKRHRSVRSVRLVRTAWVDTAYGGVLAGDQPVLDLDPTDRYGQQRSHTLLPRRGPRTRTAKNEGGVGRQMVLPLGAHQRYPVV